MKTKNTLTWTLLLLLILSLVVNVFWFFWSGKTKYRISNTEKLFDLYFTSDQRDSMTRGVEDATRKYKAIHDYQLDNSVSPAFIFSPVPVGYSSTKEQVEIPWKLSQNVILPDNFEELCFYSVADLSVLIKSKKISSETLTRMYLERLKKYDPELHCVITLLEERAIEQAQKADAEIARGKYRGPLHGIPYGVKDLLALKGYPFTFGSKIYKDQVPAITSPVVEKLDEAGAVLVAKFSLGELAMDDVWFGGMTRSPWNTEIGSSGSSAGSASATAAGLVAFSIGSETWGSIVSPSTRCGTTGLRPTFGRVSRTGAMALSWTMDKIGPICRTAEDCAMVFDAIKGKDGIDPTLVDVPFNYNPGNEISKLRVGFVPEYFNEKSGSNPNDSLTIEVLKKMGLDLIPVTLPDDFPSMTLSIILEAEAAAAFSDLTLTGKDTMMVRQTRESWPNLFRQARLIPAVEYIQANRMRTKLIGEFIKLFKKVDVIVCPSFAGNQLLMTNLTGHPALVIPNGFDDKGMPTTVTFIADWYNEADLLLVGSSYQKAAGFLDKHPEKFLP